MARLLDVLFFLYFLSHIPVTIFIDSQALFPASWYPKQLRQLMGWYLEEFRDPLMTDPPAWFRSFIWCEMFAQLPFFFLATYAFFKGAQACKWIRVPLLIYGSHVATTLICIGCHVLLHDFQDSPGPAPRNMNERLRLLAIYSPYFILPVMQVLDASFSSVYSRTITVKGKAKSQ